eukprot:scaffold6910_cov136-Isochrysis_galbana.AAC.5
MSSPAACCGLDNDVHLCSLLQKNAVGLPYRFFLQNAGPYALGEEQNTRTPRRLVSTSREYELNARGLSLQLRPESRMRAPRVCVRLTIRRASGLAGF